MGWQRFNRGTKIFEVSDDNGASWQPIVIAAAGLTIPPPVLPSNVAYKDSNNHFTTDQAIAGAIFERNRAVAMGEWTAYTPTFSAASGVVSGVSITTCQYMLIGKTLHVVFYLGLTLSLATQYFNMSLPAPFNSSVFCTNPIATSITNFLGTLLTFPGDPTNARLYCNVSGSVNWPAGNLIVSSSTVFPIA